MNDVATLDIQIYPPAPYGIPTMGERHLIDERWALWMWDRVQGPPGLVPIPFAIPLVDPLAGMDTESLPWKMWFESVGEAYGIIPPIQTPMLTRKRDSEVREYELSRSWIQWLETLPHWVP